MNQVFPFGQPSHPVVNQPPTVTRQLPSVGFCANRQCLVRRNGTFTDGPEFESLRSPQFFSVKDSA